MSSTTNPVGSSSNSSASSGTSSAQSAIQSALNITPADFLKLITTQLQDQNPMQPTDPTQFLGQLEQMSEVSSMQNMETSLNGLTSSLQSTQMANGAALLGQTVLAPGTTATLDSAGGTGGGSVTGALQIPSGATSATVTIKDSAGATLDTLTLTPAKSGVTHFTWNGTNTLGTAVPAGQYTITAQATNGSSSATLTPLIAAKVNSVTVDSSTNELDINTENGSVPLSSVVSIL
jgi:flagellar basal-body rod modification protein FlgD